MGTIFSGSCVVDKDNTAGFGAGAVIAFYTSASDRQVQSMAYSLDNGKTFKKYARNPILTSTQRDFRDPKVIWHEDTKKWIMVLAVGQEMEIYSSADLKSWTLESKFGEGQGAHGGVWECPDLFELPVEGTELKKWVLVCNLNPGGPFGGSATQYFVGTFDGKRFVNESPAVTKWMDWGKDHYATVTWSNAPAGRAIALAWMSNWQYANYTPIQQFRSANALPRELSLYTGEDKQLYLSAAPVKETENLRKDSKKLDDFTVNGEKRFETLFENNDGAFELELQLTSAGKEAGFELLNSLGEKVRIYLDAAEGRVVMDRAESGIVDFGKKVKPHDLDTEESYARYKEVTVNYKNDFALGTWAPINTAKGHKVQVFVDNGSVELFVDGGRIAMTNLVFPNEPYNSLRFYSEGGEMKISDFTIYKLGL